MGFFRMINVSGHIAHDREALAAPAWAAARPLRLVRVRLTPVHGRAFEFVEICLEASNSASAVGRSQRGDGRGSVTESVTRSAELRV